MKRIKMAARSQKIQKGKMTHKLNSNEVSSWLLLIFNFCKAVWQQSLGKLSLRLKKHSQKKRRIILDSVDIDSVINKKEIFSLKIYRIYSTPPPFFMIPLENYSML